MDPKETKWHLKVCKRFWGSHQIIKYLTSKRTIQSLSISELCPPKPKQKYAFNMTICTLSRKSTRQRRALTKRNALDRNFGAEIRQHSCPFLSVQLSFLILLFGKEVVDLEHLYNLKDYYFYYQRNSFFQRIVFKIIVDFIRSNNTINIEAENWEPNNLLICQDPYLQWLYYMHFLQKVWYTFY